MSEEQPFTGDEEFGPDPLPLDDPNVTSTFDTPPSEDAQRAHDAAIRRHLQDQRSQQEQQPPEGS